MSRDYMSALRDSVSRAAQERGPLRYSWDAACARGISYTGWRLDELLRHLIYTAASERCAQCGLGDCAHDAARVVAIELAEVEPDDASEVTP